jgi:hypothetical protein
VYPFNGQLEDGTYSWELRLIKKNAAAAALSRSNPAEDGEVDENGRSAGLDRVAISAPYRKTLIKNIGRDSTQSGGFRVVDGSIPDMKLSEQETRQKAR